MRQMLSFAAQVYDPLGYISPFIGQMKLLFQRLWTLGLGWDTLLPPEIERQWRSWQQQLKTLVELHIFGDASQVAYAACACIMVESINHHKSVSLVMAKSRVELIKQVSLPRLELMAALLCARLKKYLERDLTLSIQEIPPVRWKSFVANRVQEIQESVSPQCWRYCPTKENPADIPSRGCSLGTLINTALWWHGPPWLMQDRENWPTEPVARIDDNEHLTAEQKTVKVLASQIDGCGVEQVINPTRYCRYETLIRVTDYCLRFARNCQNPVSERTNNVNLSVKELSDAEVRWLREVQVKEFGIKPDSGDRVREFQPFLDQDGLLRVGGRLRRSTLPPESKHPIILPHNHP
ncbi:hypothetical protein T12_4546, partial [Trichinella patagoniensis]